MEGSLKRWTTVFGNFSILISNNFFFFFFFFFIFLTLIYWHLGFWCLFTFSNSPPTLLLQILQIKQNRKYKEITFENTVNYNYLMPRGWN